MITLSVQIRWNANNITNTMYVTRARIHLLVIYILYARSYELLVVYILLLARSINIMRARSTLASRSIFYFRLPSVGLVSLPMHIHTS